MDSSCPRNFASVMLIFELSPLYWVKNIWIIICEIPWSRFVETLFRTISSTRIVFLLTTIFGLVTKFWIISMNSSRCWHMKSLEYESATFAASCSVWAWTRLFSVYNIISSMPIMCFSNSLSSTGTSCLDLTMFDKQVATRRRMSGSFTWMSCSILCTIML